MPILATAQEDLLRAWKMKTEVNQEVSAAFKGLKSGELWVDEIGRQRRFFFIVSHRFERLNMDLMIFD